MGGVYSAGGQLVVQESRKRGSKKGKKNGAGSLFGDTRIVVAAKGTKGAHKRQNEMKRRAALDWTERGSNIRHDFPTILTDEKVKISGGVSRRKNTLNGLSVNWRLRKKAQLIPRAKLRTPLPNYQKLRSTFTDKSESERETEVKSGQGSNSSVTSTVDEIIPNKFIGQEQPLQMIRIRDSTSSQLHSEQIRIAREAAVFQLEGSDESASTVSIYSSTLPAKFSSRYEIYNSGRGGSGGRPFGIAYRELTFGCSSSGSSTTSDSITNVTCTSEVDSVHMTGFQCISEEGERHVVSVQNEGNYEDIYEATNFNVSLQSTDDKVDNVVTIGIPADKQKRLFHSNLHPKTISKFEACKRGSGERSDGSNRIVTRCKSLLNLEMEHPASAGKETKLQQKFHSELRLNKQSKDYDELVNDNVVVIEGAKNETCRVTGELLKNSQLSCTLPRTGKWPRSQLQRHFYHPSNVKTKLKDEELPDPDKVKTAREHFEKVLKIRSCEDICKSVSTSSPVRRPTHEIRVVSPCNKRTTSLTVDCDASVSSGVGSDFDMELSPRPDSDVFSNGSTDEDYVGENEGKPVSPEVLQRIRDFGTSVTYYGGRIVASTGQIYNPLTMTIMNEIRKLNAETGPIKKLLDKNPKFKLIKSNSCGSQLEITPVAVTKGSKDVIEEAEDESCETETSASLMDKDVRTYKHERKWFTSVENKIVDVNGKHKGKEIDFESYQIKEDRDSLKK